jgi:hypothetical protein
MNTLVDPQDGPQDGAKDGAIEVSKARAETAGAAGDAAGALASSDATLIELAPASGRTLILPEGPAGELKRALADLPPGPATAHARPAQAKPAPAKAWSGGAARRWLARAQALIGPRDQRWKRLAPFAVGLASLLATGLPLWLRSPRPPAADQAALKAVRIAPTPASPLTVEYSDDLPGDRAAVAEQAAETAGATAIATGGGAHPAGARLVGDRRGRTRTAAASRWKGRGWVLRTRNGSPVVD